MSRFTNVRRHVILSHLPWYVSPFTACWTCKVQLAQERLIQVHVIEYHNKVDTPHTFSLETHGNRWIYLMNGLLLEISNQLEKPVSDLVEVVRLDPKFSICTGSFHHWTDMQLLKKFVNLNQYSKDLELSQSISTIWYPFIITLEIFSTTDLQNRIYWKYHFLRERT